MNIATLKQTTRLEQVIQQAVPLQPKGRVWVGRCPFHADRGRPNLVVFPATQTWMCFVCGWQGDVLDWIQRYEQRSLTSILQDPTWGADGPPRGPSPAFTPRAPQPRASADHRDRVYRQWRAHQPLPAADRADLMARGFTPATIRYQGFCRLNPGPVPPGLDGAGVPGFAWRHHRWESVGPAGLWIPIRNLQQQVVGAQIRVDTPNTGKYRWFSSARFPQGTAASAEVHVELGAGSTVWITEGPIKAMLLHQTLHHTVLGLPGVGTWRKALPLLTHLAPHTVVIALDQQDPQPAVREKVQAITQALGEACQAAGMPVGYAHWDTAKGIDDALLQHDPLRITAHPVE